MIIAIIAFRHNKATHTLFGLGAALILVGCVIPFGEEVRGQVNKEIRFGQLIVNPEAYIGEVVLLGGRILESAPEESRTEITVLEQPLSFDYSPIDGDRTGGRFLLKVDGFLDPAVYSPGRGITTVARVMGVETRAVGEKPYTYPVLKALEIHLWPPPPDFSDYPYLDPHWGPYWGPYWGPHWVPPHRHYPD